MMMIKAFKLEAGKITTVELTAMNDKSVTYLGRSRHRVTTNISYHETHEDAVFHHLKNQLEKKAEHEIAALAIDLEVSRFKQKLGIAA